MCSVFFFFFFLVEKCALYYMLLVLSFIKLQCLSATVFGVDKMIFGAQKILEWHILE